jgi:histidyl-tRNA synthetase
MAKVSVSIPKGTRDFSPSIMVKRQYLFSVVRSVFELYGYSPLETPSMENLDTLTGKYGDEGDQLLFKILNNGAFAEKANETDWNEKNHKRLVPQLCDRALRYDLTVPFARFVAMNQNEIAFPFKRYQIQPVWRADRPQKGRYREFFQCDVDIIGTDSLWSELELMKIYDEVFTRLNLPVVIHVNNRKMLQGLADVCGMSDKFVEMTVALDKLDKIGWDGVIKEMAERGMESQKVELLQNWVERIQHNPQVWNELLSNTGLEKAKEEWDFLQNALQISPLKKAEIVWDITLARGLNYYTGFIFEVKAKGVSMGSIGGGGRYDDLTGIFGLPDMSGVGISFGADRIYDVLEELNLFPSSVNSRVSILFANFSEETIHETVRWVYQLREKGIACDLYPSAAKMKKQFKYADDRQIPFVAVMGDEEMKQGKINVKNMASGEQQLMRLDELLAFQF